MFRVAVLLLYFPSFLFANLGYSKQNYCLEELPSAKLSLECPDNQLLKLGRIIYGYSWTNDCSYIDRDCTMDVPREDILCFSTTNCTVRVVEHPLILQDCWNLAATYVQAEYECLPDYSLQNMCQTQDLVLTNGFLSTPNYPNGFPSNVNCFCTLVSSAYHSIVLEMIHFHLPICAEAGLVLGLGQDFQTKCLTQEPVTMISNTQQNITLRFYTFQSAKQGGFLMKYSAIPESSNATVRLQCHVSPISQLQNLSDQNKKAKELININANDLFKRPRPTLSTIDVQKNVSSVSSTQSSAKKPSSTPSPRTNMPLIIVFIVSIVVFLVIINIFLWFMCSSRPRSSKSSSSIQHFYSHQTPSNSELHKSGHRPIPQPSNRLKTIQSLLYADHKTVDTDPTSMNAPRESNSALSEYHRSTHSSSANLNHGFMIKSKSSHTLPEPRQINSWDDI